MVIRTPQAIRTRRGFVWIPLTVEAAAWLLSRLAHLAPAQNTLTADLPAPDVPCHSAQRPAPTGAKKFSKLREWRVSIMREKVHYLGRVVAVDKDGAIDKAIEEFRIEPARRFRLIAEAGE